jgi:hypothetical protein
VDRKCTSGSSNKLGAKAKEIVGLSRLYDAPT